MKTLKSLFIIFTGLCIFYACRKNDNPKLPDGISKGVLPVLTQDDGGDVVIQLGQNFKTSFTVGLYFPEAPKPQKMDIVVRMNDGFTLVRTLQSNITSFPAKINVTGAQLAQLFNLDVADIPADTKFEIRANITNSEGKVLPGFNYGINGADTFDIAPYGTDPQTNPGANISMVYQKVCPLFMKDFVASGTLQVKDPGFAKATYTVKAALDPADTSVLILTDWQQVPGAVIKVKADVQQLTAAVASQTYANSIPGYTGTKWTVKGAGDFATCDKAISLKLTNSSAEKGYGQTDVTITP
ncbi:hypothetical protein [Chitinophaga solisilvae]|uniref:Uncharacterized protein n=1 Tax=Chitinophaga solisilvae TaxID=1233460 RepID=A0A3S1AZ16_9BACT|nr:hypothetical protein [Chitinophaga solisilvae]NSL89106.1 hypothetical protein [Chitinophaga solisilvae]